MYKFMGRIMNMKCTLKLTNLKFKNKTVFNFDFFVISVIITTKGKTKSHKRTHSNIIVVN